MSWGWFSHPYHRKTHSRKRGRTRLQLPIRCQVDLGVQHSEYLLQGPIQKNLGDKGWTYGLMVQKSGEKTTWDVWILVNNGISTTNLNWLAGFLNHQPYEEMSQQMFAGFQLWVALEGPKKNVTILGSTVFCWWYFRMDLFCCLQILEEKKVTRSTAPGAALMTSSKSWVCTQSEKKHALSVECRRWDQLFLVGGFNPFEKYQSKWDHFPKDRGWI